MTRTNRSPSAGSTIVNTLRPYEGGTGQTTAAAARTALNLVAATDINQPNGVAGLGVDGKIQASQMPDNGPAPFGVQGPSTVVIGSSTNYTITNYDIFTTYTLTAISGSVDRNGSTISYTAPGAGGAGGFILNGRQVNVAVQNVQPSTPVLAAVDVASGVANAALSCTGSTFSMNTGNGTHASSDWQVASDSSFTTIVSQSAADATNKVNWTSGALALNTTYYARVRYRDNVGGVSDWSNTVSVTTKTTYVINVEEAKLVASDKAASDQFGYASTMSSDGTRVAITSYGATVGGLTLAGAVYVFLRTGTTWSQEQKLQAATPLASARFGTSLSMSDDGTRLAIGAAQDTGASTANAGAAYIFIRSGTVWTQEAKIASDAPTAAFKFGVSICISPDGTRLVVGEVGSGTAFGSAKVYSRSGSSWTFEATFRPTGTLRQGDQWGSSVTMNSDGTRLALGSILAVVSSQSGAGTVVTATRSGTTWTQEQSIPSPDPESNGAFGSAISLTRDNSRIVIGASGATITTVPSAGAAYVYSRSGSVWTQEAKVNASDRTGTGTYGSKLSVNADGTRFVVGNSGSGSGGVATAGQAYIYVRSGTSWTEQNILSASDKSVSDLFAASVAMAGNTSRVLCASSQADPSATNNAGAAYVFR